MLRVVGLRSGPDVEWFFDRRDMSMSYDDYWYVVINPFALVPVAAVFVADVESGVER